MTKLIGFFTNREPTYKTKKITGTTPPSEGEHTFTIGIDADKILGISVLVKGTSGIYYPPHHGIQGEATEYYFAYVLANGRLGIYVPSNATAIHGRPFTCLVTYEE